MCVDVFLIETIYQTQMKIRHIVKTTYISTNLSVFVRVSHPDEDRQVGRNIGGLYNVSYLHLCLIYLTVILRGRAGYELIYITNEAVGRVGYYQLISGKSEKNNCFSKFSSNF